MSQKMKTKSDRIDELLNPLSVNEKRDMNLIGFVFIRTLQCKPGIEKPSMKDILKAIRDFKQTEISR